MSVDIIYTKVWENSFDLFSFSEKTSISISLGKHAYTKLLKSSSSFSQFPFGYLAIRVGSPGSCSHQLFKPIISNLRTGENKLLSSEGRMKLSLTSISIISFPHLSFVIFLELLLLLELLGSEVELLLSLSLRLIISYSFDKEVLRWLALFDLVSKIDWSVICCPFSSKSLSEVNKRESSPLQEPKDLVILSSIDSDFY